MLNYLYVFDYDDIDAATTTEKRVTRRANTSLRGSPKLSLHASLYGLGEKYGIKGLKIVAHDRFKQALSHPYWKIPVRREEANPVATNAIIIMTPAVETIYSTTPESDEGLRIEVVDYLISNIDYFVKLDVFKNLMSRVPELSYALLVSEVENRFVKTRLPSAQSPFPCTIRRPSSYDPFGAEIEDMPAYNRYREYTDLDRLEALDWVTPHDRSLARRFDTLVGSPPS